MKVLDVRALPPWQSAIEAVDDLLTCLRLDHAFASSVARSAWASAELDRGAVDVIAVMTPEQKSQVAMMASNRGFEVDRDAVEATAELDLVPLGIRHGDFLVRIHVLVASNALYAMMVKDSVGARIGDRELKVVKAEDLALMLMVAGAEGDVDEVIAAAASRFDRTNFNRRLVSIGLPHKVLPS